MRFPLLRARRGPVRGVKGTGGPGGGGRVEDSFSLAT